MINPSHRILSSHTNGGFVTSPVSFPSLRALTVGFNCFYLCLCQSSISCLLRPKPSVLVWRTPLFTTIRFKLPNKTRLKLYNVNSISNNFQQVYAENEGQLQCKQSSGYHQKCKVPYSHRVTT